MTDIDLHIAASKAVFTMPLAAFAVIAVLALVWDCYKMWNSSSRR